jgi:hypothetical protein
MKAHGLVVLVAATLVAACAVTPTPSPATPAPSVSPSSVVVVPSPSPSPSPSPTPLTAAAIECAPTIFKTVFAGTLACDEAIAAALAALPQGHSPLLKAAFTYRLPCPLSTRCPDTTRVDTGFVIITSKDGGLELVRVVKAANGTISTTGPAAYSPPA